MSTPRLIALFTAPLLLAGAAVIADAATPYYRAVSLPAFYDVFDIADDGSIVGTLNAAGHPVAVASNGTVTAIEPPDEWRWITPVVMSRSGLVALRGYSLSSFAVDTFLWRNGVFIDRWPGVEMSSMYGVNDSGVVVGCTFISAETQAPVKIVDGTLLPLSTPLPVEFFGCAVAINDAGDAVGGAYHHVPVPPPNGREYLFAYRWDTAGNALPLPALVPPPPFETFARDIDAVGNVVGYSEGHAVLWASSGLIDLGGPAPASALRINAAGRVIGGAGTGGALWDSTGPQYFDLLRTVVNPDGITVLWPKAINATGAILAFANGTSVITDGYPVLLIPTSAPPAPVDVPGPGGLLAILLALAVALVGAEQLRR